MATISLTIDDSQLTRVVTGLCNGVNPTNAKAKQAIIDLIKDAVRDYEVGQVTSSEDAKVSAAQSSRVSAITAADSSAKALLVS